MEEVQEQGAVEAPKGAFEITLKRNNKQIRDDRAQSIIDVARIKYKRKVEDIEFKINEMQREQINMIDLSPTNAQSLMLASDFDADAYVEKDLDLGVKIRNESIKLEVARKRYNHLFGGNM